MKVDSDYKLLAKREIRALVTSYMVAQAELEHMVDTEAHLHLVVEAISHAAQRSSREAAVCSV